MKAQGFDYTPVDPQAQRAALVGQAGMSEEDFNKQYGYGITTLYGKEQTPTPSNPNVKFRRRAERRRQGRLRPRPLRRRHQRHLRPGARHRRLQPAGGCTKQAVEKVFGGVTRVPVAAGEARRPGQLHPGGRPHGQGRQGVVEVHATPASRT
jgi:hypothetical protein